MMKAVGLTGTCPHCGESVEIIVSKKQLKALLKGMKAGTPSQANCIAEQLLGIAKKGDLRF
jgi:hypothetical protein